MAFKDSFIGRAIFVQEPTTKKEEETPLNIPASKAAFTPKKGVTVTTEQEVEVSTSSVSVDGEVNQDIFNVFSFPFFV